MHCITNYIKNKSIESNKVNNVLDLKGIGEAAWSFISAIYESGWDLLIANKDNQSFRHKFLSKFAPKIKNKPKNNKSDKLASFIKLPSPILAKTPKIKEILKFFKKNSQPTRKRDTMKSYVQVLFSSFNTKEILQTRKHFQISKQRKYKIFKKIINNDSKSKPKLNMTMKGLSRKQVIVSMNNENKSKFMEVFSTHILILIRL